MSKSPAFQFYPGDWLSSLTVTSMTPAQEGAYIRLLALAWGEDDCGLPDDDTVLAQLSRLGEGWFNGGSTLVRKCFTKRGNRLYNERLLEERKKQSAWREKSKQAGIKSGKSRRDKHLDSEPTFKNGCHLVGTKCEPNTNSSSSSSSSSSNTNTDTPISPSEQSETLPGIEPSTESKPKSKPLTPERIMRAWNRMADDTKCSSIRELSTSRRKILNARLKETFFREHWLEVLYRIAESPFLQGENDRNWKCDFDWFINETNFVKIAEGKYNKDDDYDPERPYGGDLTVTEYRKMCETPNPDWDEAYARDKAIMDELLNAARN